MQLFLDVGFKGAAKYEVTFSLKASGFLGRKKDHFYFSPNLMFFDERQIIAQILCKDDDSLVVRPQLEMEMHLQGPGAPHQHLLRLSIQKAFENLSLGDDVYIGDQRFSFCMHVSKESVKLSKVCALG